MTHRGYVLQVAYCVLCCPSILLSYTLAATIDLPIVHFEDSGELQQLVGEAGSIGGASRSQWEERVRLGSAWTLMTWFREWNIGGYGVGGENNHVVNLAPFYHRIKCAKHAVDEGTYKVPFSRELFRWRSVELWIENRKLGILTVHI